jgi:sugar O-acyltransferase (sialic acid O-acetyltransferase NeuD family)
MSGEDVFVVGTGSFAAEVADWARASGASVVGLIEMRDPGRVGTVIDGLRVGGPQTDTVGAFAVLGLGGDRRTNWNVLAGYGWRGLRIAHPTACMAADARLGSGTTLGPLTVVGARSVIGDHTIISRGSLVGHHVTIGAFTTVNPGVNIGGNSTIEAGVFVGMGATIINNRTVGAGAIIGAGALVLHDVPAGARVQGVPAREVARS